jgi:hypothetical protein
MFNIASQIGLLLGPALNLLLQHFDFKSGLSSGSFVFLVLSNRSTPGPRSLPSPATVRLQVRSLIWNPILSSPRRLVVSWAPHSTFSYSTSTSNHVSHPEPIHSSPLRLFVSVALHSIFFYNTSCQVYPDFRRVLF